MIGNRLEQDIIKVFQDNITETYSINAHSKLLGKAYPYINRKTNFFIKEGILRKINLGNSYQCFLNLKSEKTKIFMMMNELNKRDFYIQKNKISLSEFEKDSMKNSIILSFDKDFYIISASNDVISGSFRLKSMAIDKLAELILNGHGSRIIVLNNIENYVNIISGLGDEILLKGLTRKE